VGDADHTDYPSRNISLIVAPALVAVPRSRRTDRATS
jgi:hypothetical protein